MTELRLVRANGIQLAYRESGSPAAPPLLLLHALGENSADWDEVAAHACRAPRSGRPGRSVSTGP